MPRDVVDQIVVIKDLGAYELLLAGDFPRNDQGGGALGEDFTNRVVASHAYNKVCRRQHFFHHSAELVGSHTEPPGPFNDFFSLPVRHKRSGNQHALKRQWLGCGFQHVQVCIHYGKAVSATAGGYHHQFLIFVKALFFAKLSYCFLTWDLSGDVSGEKHLFTDMFGNRVFLNWIVEFLISVNPDFAVKLIQNLIYAFPFPVFLDRDRVVHDIPQPQDGPSFGHASLQPFKSGKHFLFKAERLLVDDKKMGFEGFSGGGDDVFSDVQDMTRVDLDGQRKVFLVGLLNHPWDPDKIHLLGERKTPDNRGTRQNEDVNVLTQQMGSNCHGPPDVTETIRVMGVHQDIIRRRFSFHSTFRSTEPCDGKQDHQNSDFFTSRVKTLYPS